MPQESRNILRRRGQRPANIQPAMWFIFGAAGLLGIIAIGSAFVDGAPTRLSDSETAIELQKMPPRPADAPDQRAVN